MIAYIKSEYNDNHWKLTTDSEVILNTEHDCVIAENVDEALEVINRNYNPYGPDFIVAYKQEYRGYEPTVYSLKEPVVRENMTFFEALELMKRTGKTIRVRDWEQKNKWVDEINNKHFSDFGVFYTNYTFEYNEKKAARQRKQYYTGVYRPVSPRKNFIRAYELVSLKNGLNNEFRSAVWSNYGFNDNSLGISVTVIEGDERKEFISKYIMMSLEPFNKWFGHGSYRKTEAFQRFKKVWKKQKPRSAKAIGISQELFDFMEEEVKVRAPRSTKFKGKKVIRNDKSYDV